MIEYWKLAKDFKPGDSVQRLASGQGGLSPFTGRVLATHKGAASLDVQFPYGTERLSFVDAVKVDPRISAWLPPTLDRAATPRTASVAGKWRTTELPAGFHRDLAKLWSRAACEIGAYDQLWRRYASSENDSAIRSEITQFYLVARNLAEFRIQQHATKSSTYWAASNRQYRVTTQEHVARKPSCPKCGTAMRKTTYKMREGSRERLFACPKDLFLLKQSDIVGPGGEPVEW